MRKLSIRMFVPSLRSDWNNGNAHFLRGLARALVRLGHELKCYEPEHGWSHENLLALEGESGRSSEAYFFSTYPDIPVHLYCDASLANLTELTERLDVGVRDADIVIVHEWSSPALIATLIELRARHGFRMLFHDTHHRASSSPEDLQRLQVRSFDGVVAFGEALQRIYRERFGIAKTFVLHEAADTSVFRPMQAVSPEKLDVTWVGNWGDGERNRELHTFLINPAKALADAKYAVYGVRYSAEALGALDNGGIEYRGYLQNLCAPFVYASAKLTLHIPRQQYSDALTGIPTIRVFEALACGIPLVCSPWLDTEKLFAPQCFWMASDEAEMTAMIGELLRDEKARRQLAAEGLRCILGRHTCEHRAIELTAICEELLR